MGTETQNKDKKEITLDGKVISSTQLAEAQQNPSVRIVETSTNAYKTLQRIQG